MAMKLLLLAALTTALCTSAASAASPAPPSAETVLKTLVKAHPRLMLTDSRLAELKTLAKTDATLVRYVRDVIRTADRDLKKPMLVHKLQGPRLLSISRECLSRVYSLGLAWRWTGKPVYADKIRDNLLAVCAFKDWNPSHFLDTAEMSNAVGTGYDWIRDTLSPADTKRIIDGLIKNGLTPGADSYTGKRRAWWKTSAFNWNQVCNSGLTIGALAIADTHPQYARIIVPGAVASLPKAIASYAPDGAWGEGPGYWSYATRYTVYGLAAMQTALGADFGLSELDGLDQAGRFPVLATGPTGLLLNYADSGERASRRGLPPLFYLAKAYDDQFLAWSEHKVLTKRSADAWHVIWYTPKPDSKKLKAIPLDTHFRGIVAVTLFRSSWDDPNATFVGVKAGYNLVNHGHLDLGNFELDALGVRWARDLGSDNYNMPGYWSSSKNSSKRWTYYRLNSKSHNVCMIDGKSQDVRGKAKFLFMRSEKDSARTVVDLTSAYSPASSKSLRGVSLLPGRRAVLVQDEFQLVKPAEITWGMTTDAKIAIKGSAAMLSQDGKQLRVEILSPPGATFTSASAEQKPPERSNKGVRRLLATVKASKGPVRIVVVLTPVAGGRTPNALPAIKPLSTW